MPGNSRVKGERCLMAYFGAIKRPPICVHGRRVFIPFGLMHCSVKSSVISEAIIIPIGECSGRPVQFLIPSNQPVMSVSGCVCVFGFNACATACAPACVHVLFNFAANDSTLSVCT